MHAAEAPALPLRLTGKRCLNRLFGFVGVKVWLRLCLDLDTIADWTQIQQAQLLELVTLTF